MGRGQGAAAKKAWRESRLGITGSRHKKLTEVIDTVTEKNIGIKPAAYLYEKGKELYKGARPAIPYRELTDAQQFFLAFNGAVCQVRDSIKKMLPKKDNRMADNLVIFIDDLDRCEDMKILEILEAIKLYLNTRSCVFILGIDPDAVERAIIRSREDCGKAEARQYMAKLVQGSVHVPVCRDFRPFIGKIIETWPEELQDKSSRDTLARIINEIWEHNPRKVKNFLNTLLARWKAINAAGNTAEKNADGEKLNLDQTALLLSLQLRFPAIYKSIAFHPEDFENFLRALDYVIQHELRDTSHGKQPQSSESEEEQSWEQSGAEEQPEEQSDEGLRRRYIEELSIIFSQDKSVKLSLEAYRDRLFEYRYDRRLFERIRSDFRGVQPDSVKLFFTTKAGRQ